MAKRVMLSDEAYRVLKAAKKEGESFSDVILRGFGRGSPAVLFNLGSVAVGCSKAVGERMWTRLSSSESIDFNIVHENFKLFESHC